MDIVLDSSVLCANYTLSGSTARVFLDYVSFSKSRFVIPQVVIDEVMHKYADDLRKAQERLETAARNLGALMPEGHPPAVQFDVEKQIERYHFWLIHRLVLFREYGELLPHNNSQLPEAVRRTINRIKPCADHDKGFRDTLIWLTTIEAAARRDDRTIVFITNNKNDFSGDNGNLHPTLLEDAAATGVSVEYYENLASFNEAHASKIDWVTEEWINNNIPVQSVESLAADYLNAHGYERLLEWASRKGEPAIGIYPISNASLTLHEYFAWDMSDGSIYIEAHYSGQSYIEFDFEVPAPPDDDRDEWDDDQTSYSRRSNYSTSSRIWYSSKTTTVVRETDVDQLEFTVGIKTVNKSAVDYHITEWGFW